MQLETDAIVLHTIKYSETSVIAHIYTEQYGNGSYIMSGVRKNRSKMAMFQPLSLVKITSMRKKDPSQIHRLTSIQFDLVPVNISSNVAKSTIALFIGEVLNRVFREEECNELIFRYIRTFVALLEESQTNYSNLHILFLMHLTQLLGVFPHNNYDETNSVFSLVHAQFVPQGHEDGTLSLADSALFARLLQTNELTDAIDLTQSDRQHLLSILLRYYDVHICSTQSIQSLEILKMVFE
ncbi:MAG: DNA repair protein RecO [Bacteroidales bacterium]|nr:DNA repair protein RecO [Bacteroidales bacterium]